MRLPPAIQSRQRRQAHSFNRVAPGHDSCGLRINRLPRHPIPPKHKGCAGMGGNPTRTGGVDSFFPLGTRGHILSRGNRHENACFFSIVPLQIVAGLKRNRDSQEFIFPHFGLFLPHFGLFLPHACFFRCASIYLSIYLFLEERERKRGGERRKTAIHGLPGNFHMLQKGEVWIKCLFFNQSVDAKKASIQASRAFVAINLKSIHGKSGNALGGVELAGQEAGDGC